MYWRVDDLLKFCGLPQAPQFNADTFKFFYEDKILIFKEITNICVTGNFGSVILICQRLFRIHLQLKLNPLRPIYYKPVSKHIVYSKMGHL